MNDFSASRSSAQSGNVGVVDGVVERKIGSSVVRF
jgi:hypothetical protein